MHETYRQLLYLEKKRNLNHSTKIKTCFMQQKGLCPSQKTQNGLYCYLQKSDKNYGYQLFWCFLLEEIKHFFFSFEFWVPTNLYTDQNKMFFFKANFSFPLRSHILFS